MATNRDEWWLLSNHGLVLAALARYGPALTLREIGDLIGVRERAAFQLISELEEAGFLTAHKIGRRNLYELHPETPLRHPLLGSLTFGDLLGGVLARGVEGVGAAKASIDLRTGDESKAKSGTIAATSETRSPR